VCQREDRHRGPGCDHHREPEAGSDEDLRRGSRVSAHAGILGRDERDPGDEFRDGNVGANQEVLGVAQRAFAALPETVEEYYYRGDAACYENEYLTALLTGIACRSIMVVPDDEVFRPSPHPEI
jgi:hypothetical protein